MAVPSPNPTGPLVVLDAKAFRVLVAVAARMVVEDGADPVAIAHSVDVWLSGVPSKVQADLRALLRLLDSPFFGLLLEARLTRFTRLSPEGQDRVLDRWRTSRFAARRIGYQGLRKLCLASYYLDETSWAPLDYAPPTRLATAPYEDSMAGTPEWIAAPIGGAAQ